MTDIVDRIIAIREALELNPTEFARRMGDKRQRVQDIERRKQRPPVDYVGRIVEKFHANAEWILTGNGEMFAEPGAASSPHARDIVREEPADTEFAEMAERELRLRRLRRLRELERIVPEVATMQGRTLSQEQLQALVDFAYLYDLDNSGVRHLMTFLDYGG